jgi:hypothetical protein
MDPVGLRRAAPRRDDANTATLDGSTVQYCRLTPACPPPRRRTPTSPPEATASELRMRTTEQGLENDVAEAERRAAALSLAAAAAVVRLSYDVCWK